MTTIGAPAPGLGAGPARGAGARLTRGELVSAGVFVAITVVGIYLVKWHPYYLKGFHAAATHGLGSSVVAGHAATAPEGWHAALSYATSYGEDIWQALVVGLLVAAGVQELLPRRLLLRLLGGRRTRSTVAAGLLAVPSMMCTCCGAPPTVALARSDVGVGATMAYWLGNPVLNPATIVFMGLVLGWRWALLRIVVGAALVFGVGVLAQRYLSPAAVPDAAVASVQAASADAGPSPRVVRRFATTLGRLCIGLVPEYAVVVLALGAGRAFLFPTMTPAIGHALWLVVLLAVTGTLFVIPTAGEIPIVQTLMGFGLGAAGAGALMITLPATSLPSLVMVGRAVPARVLAFVAGAVAVTGLVTGALAFGWGL